MKIVLRDRVTVTGLERLYKMAVDTPGSLAVMFDDVDAVLRDKIEVVQRAGGVVLLRKVP